jgi:FixJ family two-component response regulator
MSISMGPIASPSSPTGTVFIIDDDEAVRDSLRWLLEGNGFQVQAFASAESFLMQVRSDPLGVLVVDVRMPGMSGLELHEEILRRRWRLPVVLMTGHGDVPMAVASMKRGAADFIEKPFSDTELCGIVEVHLQRAIIDQQKLASARASSERLERLTGRERQVLDRIVAGRLNKQIADDLSISIKTVEAHRANVMDKLGARTMADLMRIALGESLQPKP